MSEADKVFKKSYKCPICDSNFKCLTVKQGKARMVSSDIDLKVNYRDIEPLKYDIILCPVCGYAALERYFITAPPKVNKKVAVLIPPPKTLSNSPIPV